MEIPSRLRTPVCDLLGMELPVVQTGMGWVSGARLTAATSEAGGLGMLAAATMTLDQLEAQIHEVKTRTGRPFGVNLRGDAADLEARLDFLAEKTGLSKAALIERLVSEGAEVLDQHARGGGSGGSDGRSWLTPFQCRKTS